MKTKKMLFFLYAGILILFTTGFSDFDPKKNFSFNPNLFRQPNLTQIDYNVNNALAIEAAIIGNPKETKIYDHFQNDDILSDERSIDSIFKDVTNQYGTLRLNGKDLPIYKNDPYQNCLIFLGLPELEEELKSVKGMNYDDMPCAKQIEPDDALINKLFILDQKKEMYNTTYDKIKRIEGIIEKLNNDERKIITSWYLKGMRCNELMRDLNYSESTIFRIKAKAIRTLAIQLFGIRAIA